MFKWLFYILIFATSDKYQNIEKPQKRQRKLGLRSEETQVIHSNKTSGRQLKQNNQTSLPRQDHCKTKTDTTFGFTKQGPNTEPSHTKKGSIKQ